MQLVVSGVRRQVQLKGPEQSLGHTRQHGRREAQVFRAHAADNLINALKLLLANQQKYGDSPVNIVVQGLLEKSRPKKMEAQMVLHGRHEAVKVGDSEKNMGSRKVVMPNFTTKGRRRRYVCAP